MVGGWDGLLAGLLDGEPVLLEGLLAIALRGAPLEVRLNAGALADAGYTLESGGTRVRRALHEGGFDAGDLLRLDARDLRRCPTTWAKRLAARTVHGAVGPLADRRLRGRGPEIAKNGSDNHYKGER
jgi:hypothetical protein